jgi:hypothetical protein
MNTLAWARLTIAADQVDDVERLRIATENRLRSLIEAVEIPSAGIVIDKAGKGTPEATALEAQVEALRGAEMVAVRELRRAMRSHPLGEWCQEVHGVGEKSLARLLGVIGDPAHRFDPETGELKERSVSQLRSYCGYGDASKQKRKRGVQSSWNTDARKRLYIIADGLMKQRESPYRAVYDEAREKYADCDITDGHAHNRALRAISKAFLKDLWLEARRVQNRFEDQHSSDSPRPVNESAAE